MLTNDTQSYECEDAFSVEYDEDGLDNIATSNIEYSLDDAANRDWREYISQSVQKSYTTKTYSSKECFDGCSREDDHKGTKDYNLQMWP